MSERPSSATRSLTLPAADSVRWMKLILVCVVTLCSFTAQVYPGTVTRPAVVESFLPEVCRDASRDL